MKSLRIFVCLLALVLLVAAAFPMPVVASTSAGSPNAKLTITNKALGPVTVILKGPKSYTILAPVGKTIKEIVKGDYTYEYKACGVTKTGKLPAKGAQAKLNILPCKTATVTIANFGKGTMTLTLSGPQNYSFSAGPGVIRKETVLEGTYKWTISATCGTKSGTSLIKGKKHIFWARCS
jgi:hypothetical protein